MELPSEEMVCVSRFYSHLLCMLERLKAFPSEGDWRRTQLGDPDRTCGQTSPEFRAAYCRHLTCLPKQAHWPRPSELLPSADELPFTCIFLWLYHLQSQCPSVQCNSTSSTPLKDCLSNVFFPKQGMNFKKENNGPFLLKQMCFLHPWQDPRAVMFPIPESKSILSAEPFKT